MLVYGWRFRASPRVFGLALALLTLLLMQPTGSAMQIHPLEQARLAGSTIYVQTDKTSFLVGSSPAVNDPITVIATATLDDAAELTTEVDGLVLAALASDATSPTLVAAVTWRLEQSGLFPVWRLQIEGSGESGADIITLANVAPQKGHTYETVMSYEPSTGALALRVHDMTVDRTVYAGEVDIEPHRVPLYPAAGISLKSQGDGADHMSVDQLAAYQVYLPVAATVDVFDTRARIAVNKIDRTEDRVIRVNDSGREHKGAYFFTISYAGLEQETTFGPLAAHTERLLIPLPLGEVAPGPATLTWEYVVGNHTWMSGSFELMIGWLAVIVSEPEVDTAQSEARFTVHVQSDAPVDDVGLTVSAQVAGLVYDAESNTYEAVHRSAQVPYEGSVSLSTGSAHVPLRVEMPAVDDIVLWSAHFSVEFDRAIDLRTTGLHHTFYYDRNAASAFHVPGGSTMHRTDIRVRDPFIVPVPDEKIYYMYGTSYVQPPDTVGFDAYASKDLETWYGPIPVFRPEPDFWADRQFWAPEVYFYDGRYYMFATFKSEYRRRGTQVLVADSPRGPFVPHSDGPVTPAEFEALDGHLFIDDEGTPWMIFCREWLQVQDGEMWAIQLTPDLSAAVGEPQFLFAASEARWTHVKVDQERYVTDGPFLHRTPGGQLIMLWSSGGRGGYSVGVATSESGTVLGPWVQDEELLYAADGGHAMLFETFEGDLLMALHTPNTSPKERALFLPVTYEDDRLVLRD